MIENSGNSNEQNIESSIQREETYLQTTARRLAIGVEKLDKTTIDSAREDLADILYEIKEKYNNLNQWLTLAGGIGVAGAASIALEIDPYQLSMNMGNWKELIAKEGTVLALLAVGRLGSLILKWKREATVARTVDGALNKDL